MDPVNFYNFSNMHIDLSKVEPGKTVLETFPELIHVAAYTEATDIELRLAFLLCDPRGPFSTIKRYDARLQSVCRWLKLDIAGHDKQLYDDVLALRNVKVTAIWTEYLESVFNHEWVSWFSSSILYYKMHDELRKPIDFTDDADWTKRNKLQDRSGQVYKDMIAMEKIIFVDEEIKRKSFEAAKDKIENFAEKHAESNTVV